MSEIKDATTDVFTDVLENMAFLLPEPIAPDDKPDCRAGALRARVVFSGAFSGSLQAAAPRQLCLAMACGMLGLDQDDQLPANADEDALKELVNVAAGELLEKLAGARPCFNLSLPSGGEISGLDFQALAARPESAMLIIDEMPFIALAEINKE